MLVHVTMLPSALRSLASRTRCRSRCSRTTWPHDVDGGDRLELNTPSFTRNVNESGPGSSRPACRCGWHPCPTACRAPGCATIVNVIGSKLASVPVSVIAFAVLRSGDLVLTVGDRCHVRRADHRGGRPHRYHCRCRRSASRSSVIVSPWLPLLSKRRVERVGERRGCSAWSCGSRRSPSTRTSADGVTVDVGAGRRRRQDLVVLRVVSCSARPSPWAPCSPTVTALGGQRAPSRNPSLPRTRRLIWSPLFPLLAPDRLRVALVAPLMFEPFLSHW